MPTKTVQLSQEITFNTGRQYTADGQQIKATVLEVMEDGRYRVRFDDISRMITGVVEVTQFSEAAIMTEYDAMRYTSA